MGGGPPKRPEIYDKQEIIMLYLGDKDEAQDGILRMLEVLLSDKRTVAERKQILEEEYGIQMTEKVEGGIDRMCNYSIGIALSNYERGLEQGLERGRQEGQKQGWQAGHHEAIRTVLKNGGSIELVAKLFGLTRETVEKIALE